MRICSWNVRRASHRSKVWDYLRQVSPDLALLQEVTAIPSSIRDCYRVEMRPAAWKRFGSSLKVQTAILVRGTIGDNIPLSSPWEWVNRELAHFAGNLVGYRCNVLGRDLRVLSVYSPAWPVNPDRLTGVDVSGVKLKLNRKVWVTDLLWTALQNSDQSGPPWIIAGDFNASETFDEPRPRGNRELLDRMTDLGLIECLRHSAGQLVPTYRHSSGLIRHQMDHLFVSESLRPNLRTCVVGDQEAIFVALSDHLPIIADFDLTDAAA